MLKQEKNAVMLCVGIYIKAESVPIFLVSLLILRIQHPFYLCVTVCNCVSDSVV